MGDLTPQGPGETALGRRPWSAERTRTALAWLKANPIAAVLGAGLILRLLVAFLPGFGFDLNTFMRWSGLVVEHKPWGFYDSDDFVDYTPGYIYYLWFIGELRDGMGFGDDTSRYLLKLPSIAADLGTAYLLYILLRNRPMRVRVGAAAAYLFLFIPALYVGAMWGQIESLTAFFTLLTIYFIHRGRLGPAAITFAVGFMVKPQIFFAFPFLAFWIITRHPPEWRRWNGLPVPVPPASWGDAIVAGVLTSVLIVLPFFPARPWDFFNQLQYGISVPHYQVTSFWAWNFWGIIDFFKSDFTTYLGISYRVWGFILYAACMCVVAYSLRRERGLYGLALGTAMSILLFYTLTTRMHERYLFPFFPVLLLAYALRPHHAYWILFIALAVLHQLNMQLAFMFYNEDSWLRNDWLLARLTDPDLIAGLEAREVFSWLVTLCAMILLAVTLVIHRRDLSGRRQGAAPEPDPP